MSNSVGDVSANLTAFGGVSASGSQWVAPSSGFTYILTVWNNLDPSKSVSASVTVQVIQKPVISLSANTTNIYLGGSAVITWSITNNPTSISGDLGIGQNATSGTMTVSPTTTTTYTFNASNIAGNTTETITINVTQKPVIVYFNSDKYQINQGGGATLNWNIQGATTVKINDQIITGNSMLVSPNVTTTYTLMASNPSGDTISSLAITVVIPTTFKWEKSLVYGFGQLICEENGSGLSIIYVQSDQVDSPNLITDAGGQVVGRTKNLPFGERFGQLGEKSFRRYSTHEDQEGSSIYMQARTYLPVFGRFAQVDPKYDQRVYEKESWNLYSYVANNPITKSDPTGEADPASHVGVYEGEESNGDSPSDLRRKEAERKRQVDETPQEEIGAHTSQLYSGGINPAGFSLSSLTGVAVATGSGVIVLGKDLASTSFVSANAQGNVSMYDMAALPGAQFQGSTVNMPPSQSFASTKVAADFYNTASEYHNQFPGSEKLMVNSAIRNDGALFGSHTASHTSRKPAIDVAYQDSNGRNLSGHTAASLADVDRARSLLSIGGRNGFTRTVTAIEGIGSFQIRQDHDNHIHLGE